MRATYLALAVAGSHDACVVAHVLRFEGRDLQALARVIAAQGGGQPAFAGAAGRAQHHDAAGAHDNGFNTAAPGLQVNWGKPTDSAIQRLPCPLFPAPRAGTQQHIVFVGANGRFRRCVNRHELAFC